MKLRVQANVKGIQVDEVLEGVSEEEVARRFREEVESRAPFLVKIALKGMDDRTLWRRIVEWHNGQAGATEPVPGTAAEFLAFAQRAGYAAPVD